MKFDEMLLSFVQHSDPVKRSFDGGAARTRYGFIDCEETKLKYGRDVYVNGKGLNDLRIGEQCSFTISLNQKQEPQVRKQQSSVGRFFRDTPFRFVLLRNSS